MGHKKYSKTDCERQDRINSSACGPKNLDLPFFSYGLFKTNQLSYSRIEAFIYKRKTKEMLVKGYIRHANGMPILFLNKKSKYDVLGNVYYFKEADKKKAYERIGYGKHMNMYKWKEVKIGDITANALVSSAPGKIRRSNIIEQDMKYIIREYDEMRHIHNYDWRLDPLYFETLSYIQYLIKETVEYDFNEYSKLIKTQMLYTSLWTVLDRFLTFKYGCTKKENVKSLSKEDYFKDIINDVLSRNDKSYYYSEILSAEDLRYQKFDKENPKKVALFYYYLRNNVVHSGKIFVSENDLLFEALEDLLEIFGRVLEIERKEEYYHYNSDLIF